MFANRINFSDQVDEIRYGDAHVERFFLRGVQPHTSMPSRLFAVAEGRFISAFDEEHARNVVILGAPSRIRFSLPSTRWANRCASTAGSTK